MKYQFFFPNKITTLVIANKLGNVTIDGKQYSKGIHKIPLKGIDNLVEIEVDKTLSNCEVCGLTDSDKTTYPKYRMCI